MPSDSKLIMARRNNSIKPGLGSRKSHIIKVSSDILRHNMSTIAAKSMCFQPGMKL
jgi:hypothetical protein